ncbi:pheromone processing endoprotease, partial [Gryganskiella cystojenkinii]
MTRILFATWIALLSTVVYLARASLAAVDSYIPQYDHDHRDYYLIRITQQAQSSSPLPSPSPAEPNVFFNTDDDQQQQRQQRTMGQLLGLEFESRVGPLSDYYLYSTLKKTRQPTTLSIVMQPNRLFRRSLIASTSTLHPSCSSSPLLVAREESSAVESLSNSGMMADPRSSQEDHEEELVDPIVERFYQLKKRYSTGVDETLTEEDGSGNKQILRKRDQQSQEEVQVVERMGEIYKQTLRQRIKKRAPLPESEVEIKKEMQGEASVRRSQRKVRKRRPTPGSRRQDDEDDGEEEEEEEVADDDVQMDDQVEGPDNEDSEPVLDSEYGSKEDKNREKTAQGEDEEYEDVVVEEGQETEEELEEEQIGEDQPEDGVAIAFGIEDPGFKYQWHLHNTKDRHDINVTGVWEQGINGTGVNVAIIDDGLDMTSDDLAANF